MWSAHLVFGDINKSSEFAFPERARVQKDYHDICRTCQPKDLNRHSFFDVDNDMLMAGFSSQDGLISGEDVLGFTLSLHRELSNNNIDVAFGVYLIAYNDDIDWKTFKGFTDNREMLYLNDDDYNQFGHVYRPRVCGDCLITVQRLLSLAKKLKVPICFAEMNGGHLSDQFCVHSHYIFKINDVSHLYNKLEPDHEAWLHIKGIKAHSLLYKT